MSSQTLLDTFVTKKKRQSEDSSALTTVPKRQKVEIPHEIRFKSNLANGFAFLSNFWPNVDEKALGACRLDKSDSFEFKTRHGEVFKTVEHFYQICKYLLVDPCYASTVLYKIKEAPQLKRLSEKTTWCDTRGIIRCVSKAQAKVKFDMLLQRFQSYSDQVMYLALLEKFSQNTALKSELLATGDSKLSEQGRFKKDYWCHTGQDRLGQLLMKVREKLRLSLEESEKDHLYKELGDRIKVF